MKKKILFISHDASRTGATIFLLRLLKWLKDSTNDSFIILLKKDGELIDEFKSIGKVEIFFRKQRFIEKLIKIIFKKYYKKDLHYHYFKGRLKHKLLNENIGLIYSNTATNGEILDFLSFLKCPVISHIHELERNIHQYAFDTFDFVKKYTNKYIAVSKSVKENLVKKHLIPEKKIKIIYGFAPDSDENQIKKLIKRNQLLKKLNIPLDAKIVCGSGTIGWRKGTDIFVQLLKNIHKKSKKSKPYFIWIGDKPSEQRAYDLLYDVKKAKLNQYFRLIGHQRNPLPFYSLCDVFAMVSREDPFPLVCLEAASVGKPIICFADAGGTEEFIGPDAGFIVPYLDIEEMTKKIIMILESESLRFFFGNEAKIKIHKKHDVKIIAPLILDSIKETIDSAK